MWEQYKKACDYPGILDERAVEESLGKYLGALRMTRRVQRIERGWRLSDYPSLERLAREYKLAPTIGDKDAISAIGIKKSKEDLSAMGVMDYMTSIDDLIIRNATRAGSAADAMNARDGLGPNEAKLEEYQLGRYDLSLMATVYHGAVEANNEEVKVWSRHIYDAFVAGAWLLYWTNDVLYWVAKPVVHTEADGTNHRLHSETSAALESDVEDLYFIHGVMVPEYVALRPDSITVELIKSQDNLEVRRVMIERYGQSRYLIDSGAKIVHKDDWGCLYREDVERGEMLVMVKVVNSTPEPDGSFKDYFLRVHPELRPLPTAANGYVLGQPQKLTALNAVASTFGFCGKEYKILLVQQT